ncbi:MAG TPA: hypothetical protein VFV34_19390 [Blastocatellia bacterium]|nr:hypothetical protein [Blastocatellia bacterium]
MSQIRLRLDPWPADYESALQIGELEDQPPADIDHTVEDPDWRAVAQSGDVRPEPLHFVDGVRRVEARVIADDDSGRITYGLFGSVGVGAVRIEHNRAYFEPALIKRYVVTGNGITLDTRTIGCGNTELSFIAYAAADNRPNTALLELQNLMRTAEADLATTLAESSACVFADGPLTYFAISKLPTVGTVKRLIEPYLGAEQFALVRTLAVGQRTPIFLIHDGKHDRYSWYLRAGSPRVMDHDLTGVLRLEVRSGVGIATAIDLAHLSASCLPGLAGDSVRDPRSPQNLLPVAALEHELRHRLGDALAIRRAIERTIFSESSK